MQGLFPRRDCPCKGLLRFHQRAELAHLFRAEIVPLFAQALRKLCGEIGLSGAHVLFPKQAEAEAFAQSDVG